MNDSEPLEACRRSLLEYYNSQTMTHGGYIIALVIGIITLISRWEAFAENIKAWIMFLLILSFLLGLGIYLVGRTFYWGYLAHQVLNAKLDAEIKSGKTIMLQLHEKTVEEAVKHHRMAANFRDIRRGIIIGITVGGLFYLLFSFIFLITR